MKKLFLLIVLAAVLNLNVAAQSADEYNKVEVFGGFSYSRTDENLGVLGRDQNRPGFAASVAGNFSRYVGAKFEVSGHYGRETTNRNAVRLEEKSSQYNFLGGVQVKDNGSQARARPFAHALVGAARTNGFAPTVCGAAIGFACRNIRQSYTGFAGAFGGGLDVAWKKRVSIRAIQADYNPVGLRDYGRGNGNYTQHNFRLGLGLVFH
jgi:hypothetical protein